MTDTTFCLMAALAFAGAGWWTECGLAVVWAIVTLAAEWENSRRRRW